MAVDSRPINNFGSLLGFGRLDGNGHTGCHSGSVAAVGGGRGAIVSDDRCLVAPYADGVADVYG